MGLDMLHSGAGLANDSLHWGVPGVAGRTSTCYALSTTDFDHGFGADTTDMVRAPPHPAIRQAAPIRGPHSRVKRNERKPTETLAVRSQPSTTLPTAGFR